MVEDLDQFLYQNTLITKEIKNNRTNSRLGIEAINKYIAAKPANQNRMFDPSISIVCFVDLSSATYRYQEM